MMSDDLEVVYYELVKELPGCKIGDQVIILRGDNPCLIIGNIKIDISQEYNTEWFKPVHLKDHKKRCEDSLLQAIKKYFNVGDLEAIHIKSRIDF